MINNITQKLLKIFLILDLVVIFSLLFVLLLTGNVYQQFFDPIIREFSIPVFAKSYELEGEWKKVDRGYEYYLEFRDLENQIQKRLAQEEGDFAVLVKDLKTQQVWKVGNFKQYPPASTFKVYTATLTLLSIERGDLYWGSSIILTKGLISPGPGSYFLEKNIGTAYTVENLLYRMIVLSDNTAQSMLFALLGRDKIEKRLESDLGLSNTSLENFETTNEDMASVFERHYRGEILSEYNTQYLISLLKQTLIRDRVRAGLPEGTVVANKGGTLDTSKHDVAIVYAPKTDYLIVVYTDNVDNEKAVTAIKNVSTIVWDYINSERYSQYLDYQLKMKDQMVSSEPLLID